MIQMQHIGHLFIFLLKCSNTLANRKKTHKQIGKHTVLDTLRTTLIQNLHYNSEVYGISSNKSVSIIENYTVRMLSGYFCRKSYKCGKCRYKVFLRRMFMIFPNIVSQSLRFCSTKFTVYLGKYVLRHTTKSPLNTFSLLCTKQMQIHQFSSD